MVLSLKKLLLELYSVCTGNEYNYIFMRIESLKRVLAPVFIILSVYTGLGGQGAYIPPEKPKLIVGIIVEQLRYDQIARFSDRFGEGGIRRLLNEGTFYQNAAYQYILTQSAPAHATISTGTEPAWHGITSNSWYLPLRNDLIYCTQDPGIDPVGGGYESGLHSPVHLQASTFTDELKKATRKKAKVFGIGLKEHAAILSAGHAADAAFWYDNSTGNWISSTWYIDSLPSWINDFNAMKYPEAYLAKNWDLAGPQEYYYDCVSDTSIFEIGYGGRNYFPYDLKKIRNERLTEHQDDMSLLRETPFGNTFTTDLAKKLIEKERLGKDDITDVLTVCYSSTDYIGHMFGPSSFEMADAILRLDREIRDLMSYLVDSVGKRNILVYFTSSHGLSETPGILEINRIPSGYFRPEQALYLLRSYLKVLYGEGDWVKGYIGNQLYLNRTLIEDSKISLEDIRRNVARFMVQMSGVNFVYPYSDLGINNFGNENLNRIINSYNPQKSGDIIITFKPGWVESSTDNITDHNSSYEYNSHVPLIWYGWSVDRTSVNRTINLTDIAPTLSSLINIPYPNACTGKPLFELFR